MKTLPRFYGPVCITINLCNYWYCY